MYKKSNVGMPKPKSQPPGSEKRNEWSSCTQVSEWTIPIIGLILNTPSYIHTHSLPSFKMDQII